MTTLHLVILCRGGGTRLWHKSRPEKPKPFHRLLNEETLFEATLKRLHGPTFSLPIVVAGHAHVELISSQLSEGASARLIVEPDARKTAPAIAYAAARVDTFLTCLKDNSCHW